jgi:predicted Fe-Mo cluster-binding NifX family protein/predicted DNA-binding protein (UPF0251 family)
MHNKGDFMKRIKRSARRLNQGKLYGCEQCSDDAITISLDEFEAMRLVDDEGKSQIEASQEMNVSRATLQRLLISGRRSLVQAILKEKSFIVDNNIDHIDMKGELNMIDKSKAFKVAFPSSNQETIDQHFGRTDFYVVYDVQNGEIKKTLIENKDHRPGKVPLLLKSHGVNVIICRNMGDKAIALFKHNQIDVILGAEGNIENQLNAFMNDEVIITHDPFHHHHDHDHDHEHDCNHEHGNSHHHDGRGHNRH